MKSLADIIAFNNANAREALKFGQTQLTASQAIDLNDPAQMAAYVADRDGGSAATRAAIDNALTRGTPTGDDLEAIMTPVGHADRHRRARRLPADRRPGGLQRGRPPAGRHRVQRHRLQRGQAARVRVRVRAGDEAAPDAERDQPGRVALLLRRAALVRARP